MTPRLTTTSTVVLGRDLAGVRVSEASNNRFNLGSVDVGDAAAALRRRVDSARSLEQLHPTLHGGFADLVLGRRLDDGVAIRLDDGHDGVNLGGASVMAIAA